MRFRDTRLAAPPFFRDSEPKKVWKCQRKSIMSAEPIQTSDVIGLTKVAPFSRRGFMTATAAVTAGYTLAAGPVRADVIKTDTDGLTAREAKIKDAGGWMSRYFARP